LHPLETYKLELGMDNCRLFDNDHIISEENLFPRIIMQSDTKVDLLGTYANRKNNNYVDGLGKTVESICNSTASGILVFFPS